MTSLEMRNDALFMRNEFETVGNWQIPLVRKQSVNISNLSLITCSDTKKHENEISIYIVVYTFLLMIIDFLEYTIIPKEHSTSIHNTIFF